MCVCTIYKSINRDCLKASRCDREWMLRGLDLMWLKKIVQGTATVDLGGNIRIIKRFMKCAFIQPGLHRKRRLLLYVTPQRLAKYLHVCIYWVCESEREVYLCLLKGVRVSTASHLASLCSRFVRASACQAVFVCACVSVGVCERTCACLWLREGEKLPSASVSLTTQGNGGSGKFTAFCHECCKVCFERELQPITALALENGETQEIDNQYQSCTR